MPTVERVLAFPDALATVLHHAQALAPTEEREETPLLAATGRVLAAPILAERDQPPFPRSTRDGFAVRAAEVNAPDPAAVLQIAGTVRAGEVYSGRPLLPRQAVEIMTGAPVPAELDAVLMVEHAVVEGHELRPAPGRTLAPGENIVPRGAEARAGAEIVSAGRRMAAPEIALAASCGLRDLSVFARPSVAIVATGDELVELTEAPAPFQIRNSNSYALASLVTEAGGDPLRLPIARDTRADLEQRLAEARFADLLLLSGGVSMGKYDVVEEVLAAHGAEFFFTGTLIQPGKPLVFGRLPKSRKQETGSREQGAGSREQEEADNGERKTDTPSQYFFGLPGNPVSTEVCFRLFVAPFLRALAGQIELPPRFVEARLAEDVRAGTRVTRFLPAVLHSDWQSASVELVPWQGSGDLAANARANCFAVLPAEHPALAAGSMVRVLLR